ncbi:hypothetical protein QX249_10015 [Vibrio parahaemolyticus]|uniref:Uncharacterized protein n=1 Tax=Vibrio parahaemolyticus TaxID=670 RepID=A0AAW8Q3E9_VIBPH|nr:hypothetical protein [Vibrio parahaemolyticus]EGR2229599.1 hypothetical protein [Vibrio parahaemolyticus]MDS1820993.1 hypothetical protein [Vibrio parahaemolyticus]
MVAFNSNAILEALNNTLTTDLSFENRQLVVSEQGVTMTVNFSHRWLTIRAFSDNNTQFFNTDGLDDGAIASARFNFERTDRLEDIRIVSYDMDSARLNNKGIEFETIADAHNELAITSLMIAQATSFYINNSEALCVAVRNAIANFNAQN